MSNREIKTLEQLAAVVAPKATGQEAVDKALWFLALFEADQTSDFNRKDYAHLFLGGLPAMKDSWQESLSNIARICRDEWDEEALLPTTDDEVLSVAVDIGWF